MPIQLWPQPNKVALAGDWHGNADDAVRVIDQAAASGAQWVIQLGDFGFWQYPQSSYLDALQHACERNNVRLGWIDGNRERYPLIRQLMATPDARIRAHPVRPFVYYLPRGYRWMWRGRMWVAVGGATSLDRSRRHPGTDWWPEEELTEQEADWIGDAGHADVMLSHDGPACTHPNFPRGAVWPRAELQRAQRHRERLQRVMDKVQPLMAVHGHFHLEYVERVTRGWGASIVICLDHGGSTGQHWVLLDTRTLQFSVPDGRHEKGGCPPRGRGAPDTVNDSPRL